MILKLIKGYCREGGNDLFFLSVVAKTKVIALNCSKGDSGQTSGTEPKCSSGKDSKAQEQIVGSGCRISAAGGQRMAVSLT